MTTLDVGSPSDQFALGPDPQYCSRCGHRRMNQMRLCGYCRFDFEAPIPEVERPSGPPTPSVRLVPPDELPEAGAARWGRSKRWLLLGPIAAM